MSDQEELPPEANEPAGETKSERFPELAELEENIRRRLRSNKRFLERFMDEDFSDLDDDESDGDDPEEPDQMEEL